MPEWAWVLVGVAIALIGFGVGIAREELSLRRADRVAAAGGDLVVPALVGSGERMRRARAYVEGNDVVVVAARVHLRLDRRIFAGARQRRSAEGEDFSFAEQRVFRDAGGGAHLIGVEDGWADPFDRVVAVSGGRLSRWRRIDAAGPRWALVIALMATAFFGMFQTIWAMGDSVDATMTRLVEDDDGLGTCGVRWGVPGGAAHSAQVDCYAPYPEIGDTVEIRALGSPFAGQAMDEAGSFEGFTGVTAGPALLAGAAWFGVAVIRLRRPALRLVAAEPSVGLRAGSEAGAPTVTRVVSDPDAHGTSGVGAGLPAGKGDLRRLLGRLAEHEGWDLDAGPPPRAHTWLRDGQVAVRLTAGVWLAVVLGAASLVVWVFAGFVVVAGLLGAIAVVVLIVWAVSALLSWRELRAARTASATSEWDYGLARSTDDIWHLVLFLGSTPHWLIGLSGSAHPRSWGRCGVQGELTEGALVALRIGEDVWAAGRPVLRMEEERVELIVDDVQARLRSAG